jgi:hypothetical protein
MPLWDDLPEMLMTILLAFVEPLFPAGQVKIVRLPDGGVKVVKRSLNRGQPVRRTVSRALYTESMYVKFT